MSVKKCSACGLVNFAIMDNCQRCGCELNQLAPIAQERTYQQNTEIPAAKPVQVPPPQSQVTGSLPAQPAAQYSQPELTQQFQTYELPPPPPVFDGSQAPDYRNANMAGCVKCGGRRNISIQQYKKDYVPPLVYLSILAGWLILIILILVLRKRHDISLPWCRTCWDKFKFAKAMETVTSLGCLILVFAGIGIGLAMGNMMWFAVCLFVGLGAAIWGNVYHKQCAPKYKKIDRQQVIVAPFSGAEICFQK